MQPGTRLDQYEIVDQLGQGGMGAVYRAEDTRLRRQVAIKVLPPALAANEEQLTRLEREAQLLASLNHPNLATVHGFGDVHTDVDGAEQRVTFLVMELVEGESLHGRAAMGAMPWREAVEIGVGIASGLEAAHERGIVHRDLKPANVQITPDGMVKVLDFGLAKALEGTDAGTSTELSASPTMAAATRTGVILGTAAYMSPEQARGQRIDERADLWALGCVMYELLTGRKTFDGDTVSDILASVLKESVDFDSLPPVPARLRHLLKRCLEKDPSRRIRDMRDARLELESCRTETVEARPDPAVRRGTSWILTGAVAMTALAFGLTAGYLRWGGAPQALPEAHVTISPDSTALGYVPMAVSPDGRWMAEGGFGAVIRLRAMNALDWREIDDAESAMAMKFSSDSQRLYFTSGLGASETRLYRMDLGNPSPLLVGTMDAGFATLARSLEGRLVVSLTHDEALTVYALSDNGALEQIFHLDEIAESIYLTHEVAPSRWIGVTWVPVRTTGLVFVNMETDQLEPFMAGYVTPFHVGEGRILAADLQGRLVSSRIDTRTGAVVEPPVVRLEGLSVIGQNTAAYDVTEAGTLVYTAGNAASFQHVLGWLDDSGQFEPLSERASRYGRYAFLSPDGTLIAAETALDASQPSIVIHDIGRDVYTALVPGVTNAAPVWSPDGRYVAYSHYGEESSDLYRAPVDRSEPPEPLLSAADSRYREPTSWSPDGTHLLYNEREEFAQDADLWILSLDGSGPRALLATEADEEDARFSPDGQWIAYTSDQDGTYQIYVRPVDGVGEFRISADSARNPQWDPSGGRLFFNRPYGLFVTDIDLSGATPIVSPERTVLLWPGGMRGGLYAPGPDGDRFLTARSESLGDSARSVRAIFNWSPLQEWR